MRALYSKRVAFALAILISPCAFISADASDPFCSSLQNVMGQASNDFDAIGKTTLRGAARCGTVDVSGSRAFTCVYEFQFQLSTPPTKEFARDLANRAMKASIQSC